MSNNQTAIPQYNTEALVSSSLLYKDLQDIQIFIEDTNFEEIYKALLKRLIDKIKIHKVIALHGKHNVLTVANQSLNDNTKFFIVDGDFECFNDTPSERGNVYYLDRYCIENYFFCERAAIEILYESNGVLTKEEIINNIKWSDFKEETHPLLAELFCCYAAAESLALPINITPLSDIITNPKKSVPYLDQNKLQSKINSEKSKFIALSNNTDFTEALNLFIGKLSKNAEDLRYISGKDFLLPLLRFYLIKNGAPSLKNKSLALRLAKHCSITPFLNIKWWIYKEHALLPPDSIGNPTSSNNIFAHIKNICLKYAGKIFK